MGRDSGSDREMAGISFLDLLFAEAIASGMAREARTRERPPPDNFFILPRDPRAWLQIQAASKKENMVIAVEITDDSNENCLRMQRIFMDMAREHDGMPFLRVKIGLGCTFDQVATLFCYVFMWCNKSGFHAKKDTASLSFHACLLALFYHFFSLFPPSPCPTSLPLS